jgi:phosphonoacetate hydrolase
MNPKKRCLDLQQTCAAAGMPLRFAVSPVADRLVKHHRGFGGVSYVYVHSEGDLSRVQSFLRGLPGVDEVLPRREAAPRFHLMPERIGDLVVLAGRDTVFGDLDSTDEELAPGYRNHGSLYEEDVPLILYGFDGSLPLPSELQMNFDLTRWLCRTLLD